MLKNGLLRFLEPFLNLYRVSIPCRYAFLYHISYPCPLYLVRDPNLYLDPFLYTELLLGNGLLEDRSMARFLTENNTKYYYCNNSNILPENSMGHTVPRSPGGVVQ